MNGYMKHPSGNPPKGKRGGGGRERGNEGRRERSTEGGGRLKYMCIAEVDVQGV